MKKKNYYHVYYVKNQNNQDFNLLFKQLIKLPTFKLHLFLQKIYQMPNVHCSK